MICHADESLRNFFYLGLLPSSTSSFTLSHQSQATPRSANHQSQILHNPLIPTHTSQSFTYSAVTPPPSSHPMNPVLSTDPIKLTISHCSSSSSIVPETFDNSHTPISPSQTNETNQSSLSSELTPQPPVKKSSSTSSLFQQKLLFSGIG